MDGRHGDLSLLGQDNIPRQWLQRFGGVADSSASRLYDQRLERHHDFSNKAGVVQFEVMLQDGAPEKLADREKLWNAVEAAEVRKDAQLAREMEFAISRELDQTEDIRLAREFVQAAFVDRGMIADLNVHWNIDADGNPKRRVRRESFETFDVEIADAYGNRAIECLVDRS